MKIRFGALAAIAALGISTMLHTAPAAADSVHIAGETTTYYTLSNYYGVGMDEIMNVNKSVSSLNIYPGLRLNIPDTAGKKITATANPSSKVSVISASLNVEKDTNTVQAWGKEFNYEKTLQVKASAYSAAASENGKWGAVDYFGNALKLGTIAVDPSVIPLGTKVLVTGHSHPGLPKQAFLATATDMGSAIKGNRIDIFIPGSQSFVADFGYQNVQLYVIK